MEILRLVVVACLALMTASALVLTDSEVARAVYWATVVGLVLFGVGRGL